MAVSNSAVPSADFRMQILCAANLIICTCNLHNVSNKLIYVFILQFAAEGVDTCLYLKFLIYFGDVPNVPFMSSVKPSCQC